MLATRRFNVFADHQRHGVWVPAFAGTTPILFAVAQSYRTGLGG
jgi:hypothetical protein